MKQTYKTQGVCAREIEYQITDGRVYGVRFMGGCPGNGQAVGRLVEGMPVDEAIRRLRGIQCQNGTSCADQLSRALAADVK